MAKKNDGLTPRQRQSQQIMREKAAKKKRQAFLRKWGVIGGAALVVTVAGSGVWVWKSGVMGRMVQGSVDGVYHVTAHAGFTLHSLYLEGRNRTSMEDINQALGIKKGDPILQLCLSELRDRLEKIPSVRSAAVERALPGTLYIRIVEREPVAQWQHQGKMALVDDQGNVMNDVTVKERLPLIIGDDAPKHVGELLELLAANHDLTKRFQAATHIGERRWNIRLSAANASSTSNAIDIKLPEENPLAAWRHLAELETQDHVLDRDVQVVDLRVSGRLFLTLSPHPVDVKAGAKDT